MASARHPLWFAALVLAAFVAWVASDLWITIVAAGLMAFVLRPVVRAFDSIGFPTWLGAFLAVGGSTFLLGALLYAVHAPATDAIDELPRAASRASAEVRELKAAYLGRSGVTETLQAIEGLQTEPRPGGARVVMERPSLDQRLMQMGMTALASTLAALLLVYFFLLHGDTLFRRLVEVMPTLTDKKRTVDTVRVVQADVSRYLLSITLINAGFGAVVALVLLALGVENALFWGALAGLLNYVPYLGPLLVGGALLVVGFDASPNPTLGAALAPAGAYLLLHVIESNAITPLLLGRQFAINPVVILVWLMLWGWLWGIAGLLLGVPMLVCTKVLLQRVDGLQAWATLMETRAAGDAGLRLSKETPP